MLSEPSRAALERGHVATLPGAEPDELGYGYGLFVTRGFTGPDERTYDVPVLSHGGNTLTMSSTFVVLPEQRVAVSILANSARQDTTAIAAIALEQAAKERLPEPGPPLVLLPRRAATSRSTPAASRIARSARSPSRSTATTSPSTSPPSTLSASPTTACWCRPPATCSG